MSMEQSTGRKTLSLVEGCKRYMKLIEKLAKRTIVLRLDSFRLSFRRRACWPVGMPSTTTCVVSGVRTSVVAVQAKEMGMMQRRPQV